MAIPQRRPNRRASQDWLMIREGLDTISGRAAHQAIVLQGRMSLRIEPERWGIAIAATLYPPNSPRKRSSTEPPSPPVGSGTTLAEGADTVCGIPAPVRIGLVGACDA